jgi:pimeloyl-ACP methyl ester carboxylesterase
MSSSLLRSTRWLVLAMCLCLASCAVLDRNRPGYASLAPDMASDPGLSLHYETYGHGKPVVLIHGLGLDSHTWRHLIAPLSQHHRVVTLDLKGHGMSPKPDDDMYSLYDQARLVSRFIIEHDLRNVTLIGHSYGGGVALASAVYLNRSHPNRVERLVLIDGIAYEQSLPMFVRLLATPILGPLLIHLVPETRQIRSIMELTYYDDHLIEDESIERYAQSLRSPGAKSALLSTARQILPSDIEAFAQMYRELRVPTLILWGKEDEIIPLSIGQRLAFDLPNATFEVLAETGHAQQEERPAETLRLIEGFLPDQ